MSFPTLASSSVYQGVALESFSARGREDKLQNKLNGIVDRDFMSVENSVHRPKPSVNVAPYHDEWVDQRPEATEQLGRDLIFLFGHDGNTINRACEVHFSLTFTVDVGAVIDASDMSYETVPFLGERLLGDQTLQYAQGTLRHHSASMLHVRNRLTADVTTEQDASYREHVVADPVLLPVPTVANTTTSVTVTGWVPVWVPWSVDGDNPLTINSLPEKMKLRIALPAANLLVRRARTGSPLFPVTPAVNQSNGVSVAVNYIRLRQHTVIVPKVERATLVNLTLMPRGIAWHIMDVEAIEEVLLRCEDVATTNRVHRQRLHLIVNPCAYLAMILRYQLDMAPYTLQGSAAPGGGGLGAFANPSPDWTRKIPIKEWFLAESGQQISPKYTLRYYESQIRPRLFKNGAFSGIAVLPFTRWPLIEAAGLGHTTFNNMNEPEAFVTFDEHFDGSAVGLGYTNRFEELGFATPLVTAAVTDNPSAADKRLDFYGFTKNIVAHEQGNILKLLRN